MIQLLQLRYDSPSSIHGLFKIVWDQFNIHIECERKTVYGLLPIFVCITHSVFLFLSSSRNPTEIHLPLFWKYSSAQNSFLFSIFFFFMGFCFFRFKLFMVVLTSSAPIKCKKAGSLLLFLFFLSLFALTIIPLLNCLPRLHVLCCKHKAK